MATLFSDNFNRSNENLEASANWQQDTAAANNHDVVSNEVQAQIGGGDATVTTTSAHAAVADCKVTATRTSAGGFDQGLCVRHDAADTCYYIDMYSGNKLELFRRISGSDTQVGIRTIAHGSGDSWGVEVSGTGATVTFKVLLNGSQVGTDMTDTSGSRITAAGQTGILDWASGNTVDDYLVEDFAAAGNAMPMAVHHFKMAGGL